MNTKTILLATLIVSVVLNVILVALYFNDVNDNGIIRVECIAHAECITKFNQYWTCSEQQTCVCVIPEIYSPVCGDDGKTYSNNYESQCNGVKVAYSGECKDESTTIPLDCKLLSEEIETEIENANYCTTDLDCIYLDTGLCDQCSPKFGNKNYNLNELQKLVDSYSEDCSILCLKCVQPIRPLICENNKCIAQKE
jgi:hypothetical protein